MPVRRAGKKWRPGKGTPPVGSSNRAIASDKMIIILRNTPMKCGLSISDPDTSMLPVLLNHLQ
jgi:hypothetical protein